MEEISLATSMRKTVEYGNLESIGEIGEIAIDAVLSEGVLKDIPIIGTLVGAGKVFRNVHDILFVKKLVAFLDPIKDIKPEKRIEAIEKWENDKNYRGKVGETLLGMVERCDDSIKAKWLSSLFYELVLKRSYPQLFMRAEKILSSLSVMDMQEFLKLPKDHFHYIREEECEPFLGSGLYYSPRIEEPVDGTLDLDKKYCECTEIGIWMYNLLNGFPMPCVEEKPLF